jgi:hypothetical protein
VQSPSSAEEDNDDFTDDNQLPAEDVLLMKAIYSRGVVRYEHRHVPFASGALGAVSPIVTWYQCLPADAVHVLSAFCGRQQAFGYRNAAKGARAVA